MRRFILPPDLAVRLGVSTADDDESVVAPSSTSSRMERRQKRVRANSEHGAHLEIMCTLLGSVVSSLATLSAESRADRAATAIAQEKDSVRFLMGLVGSKFK